MSLDPYSARVRDLFSAPAHAGDLDDAEIAFVADQDVRLQLAASVADGTIRAMRFRAWGCPHFIAAAESACEMLEGQPVSALAAWTASDLMQNLPVPVEKTGRILVIEDTVRSLGRQLRDRT